VDEDTQLEKSLAYLAILAKIDLERLRVVLESKGGHGEKNVFTVDSLALLLLALLRGCAS
jgi:hypothetical protein